MPQTPLGKLRALPQTPYLHSKGPTSKGRERAKGRGTEGEEGEKEQEWENKRGRKNKKGKK